MASNVGLVNQVGDIAADGINEVIKNTKMGKEKLLDEPLDIEEIEICQELIAEFYPLRDKRVYELLPWLCCCVRMKNSKMFKKMEQEFRRLSTEDDKTDEEGDWKLNDLKEIDERLSKFIKDAGAPPFEGTDFVKNYQDEMAKQEDAGSDAGQELDPYNGFGFGILEYFKLLQALLYIYIVICILLLPIMYKYYQEGALQGL